MAHRRLREGQQARRRYRAGAVDRREHTQEVQVELRETADHRCAPVCNEILTIDWTNAAPA
jgi:hypothetical protein